MRNLAIGLIIGALAVALGMGVAHAQNPALTPYQFTVTAKCAGNMNLSAAGQANWCYGTDGAFVSMSGGQPIQVAPPAAVVAGVQKVNGHAPDATGNVQLTVSASIP